MNNPKLLILWSASIILFALACILDVSTFGDWAHIDIKMIFLTFVLIILGGLFLGLLLFYRKTYKDRILFTIPIAAMIFSIFIFFNIVIYEYGLFDKYNYFSARRDIKKGKVQLINKGLAMPTENDEKIEAIRNQFGYKTLWDGCVIENNGYTRYNKVMEEYLTKINGETWQIRLQQKIDSIRNLKKTETSQKQSGG